MDESKILITGANGQLGLALRSEYPGAQATDTQELDITNERSINGFDWSGIKVILNAAGYTDVDAAEKPEGEKLAWAVNDKAVANLSRIAKANDMLLVHISTAYVFDGQKKIYTEDDPPSPLGKYAKTKAAGDKQAAKAPRHYIIRTDSVIGDGKNFVRTMLGLAKKGIAPTVVADQFIRPTFTTEIAKAIKFLIDHQAQYGIYNLTNEGDAISWADFTRAILKEAGSNLKVTDTTFQAYSAAKTGVAPRPLNSVLDLSKIESIGFMPRDWRKDLKDYVKKELDR